MPNFYSPEGNFEVWEKKPKGYFTVEEWEKAHPAPEPEPLSDEELANNVRAERDGKLAASDKYMTGDFPGAEGKEDAIKAYRKALRDVPAQSGFPKNVKWPTDPLA